jgi:ElaB/YqjD/DUF883 family membrane-anchored ribosome-binding protein
MMQSSTYPANSSNNTTDAGGKAAVTGYASSANPLASSESRMATAATKAVQSVREVVDEGRAAAAGRIDATAKWVGNAARDNPLRTLGIAAVVGVVAGLLLGRR